MKKKCLVTTVVLLVSLLCGCGAPDFTATHDDTSGVVSLLDSHTNDRSGIDDFASRLARAGHAMDIGIEESEPFVQIVSPSYGIDPLGLPSIKVEYLARNVVWNGEPQVTPEYTAIALCWPDAADYEPGTVLMRLTPEECASEWTLSIPEFPEEQARELEEAGLQCCMITYSKTDGSSSRRCQSLSFYNGPLRIAIYDFTEESFRSNVFCYSWEVCDMDSYSLNDYVLLDSFHADCPCGNFSHAWRVEYETPAASWYTNERVERRQIESLSEGTETTFAFSAEEFSALMDVIHQIQSRACFKDSKVELEAGSEVEPEVDSL